MHLVQKHPSIHIKHPNRKENKGKEKTQKRWKKRVIQSHLQPIKPNQPAPVKFKLKSEKERKRFHQRLAEIYS
jgi:hypothetical protein